MIKDPIRKHFPILFKWVKNFYYFFFERILGKSTNELIFTRIYRGNLWGNKHTRSGDGSTLENTQNLQIELPPLITSLNLESLLDIPCGDFFWMKNLDLPLKRYLGADIVKEIVAENNKKYASPKTAFLALDITSDDLPQVDLIFCRDCLPHLPNKSIFGALRQIKKSKSKYLLTSTYIDRIKNEDILIGLFHPINLEQSPFNFPKPLRIIHDPCFTERINLPDKSLGLWLVSDIPEYL